MRRYRKSSKTPSQKSFLVFIIFTTEVIDEVKTAFYKFIKTMLTSMTKNELESVFDCSINRWTQSMLFMDTFSSRALVPLEWSRSSRILLISAWIRSSVDRSDRQRPEEAHHWLRTTQDRSSQVHCLIVA